MIVADGRQPPQVRNDHQAMTAIAAAAPMPPATRATYPAGRQGEERDGDGRRDELPRPRSDAMDRASNQASAGVNGPFRLG